MLTSIQERREPNAPDAAAVWLAPPAQQLDATQRASSAFCANVGGSAGGDAVPEPPSFQLPSRPQTFFGSLFHRRSSEAPPISPPAAFSFPLPRTSTGSEQSPVNVNVPGQSTFPTPASPIRAVAAVSSVALTQPLESQSARLSPPQLEAATAQLMAELDREDRAEADFADEQLASLRSRSADAVLLANPVDSPDQELAAGTAYLQQAGYTGPIGRRTRPEPNPVSKAPDVPALKRHSSLEPGLPASADEPSSRSASLACVSADVEAQLRAAATEIVAPTKQATVAEPLRAAPGNADRAVPLSDSGSGVSTPGSDLRKRDQRLAELMVQNRVLAEQTGDTVPTETSKPIPASSGESAPIQIATLPRLKAVLKTPPRGLSPEPSPPRSPNSQKVVTWAPTPVIVSNAPSTISNTSTGSRSSTNSATALAPSLAAVPKPPPPAPRSVKGERSSRAELRREVQRLKVWTSVPCPGSPGG